MNIYFLASLSQRAQYLPAYERIVHFLEKKKHEVFGKTLTTAPAMQNATEHKIREWYKEWSSIMQECELVVVEGSYPSTIHIGFELGMILSRGKPVVLLFEQGKDPLFINDLHSGRLIKSEYTKENLEDVLKWCLDESEKISNRRFTFFISPEIEAFLNDVVKLAGMSRSEYIRGLIEQEIKKK